MFLQLKILVLMILERLYTVDGISFYDVIQNWIKMNKIKFSVVKMNRYDISRWIFYLFIWFFIYFSWNKISHETKLSSLEMLSCKFRAKRFHHFNCFFLKPSSNFRYSLLPYLRGIHLTKNFNDRWKIMTRFFGWCSGANKAFTISWKWWE